MKEPIDATTHRNLLDNRDRWKARAERAEADNAALRQALQGIVDDTNTDNDTADYLRHLAKLALTSQLQKAESDNAALQLLLTALHHVDWMQIILNQSAPCCHIEDGRFCGRAERWAGHEHFHKFVWLNDAIDAAMKDKP